MIKITIKQLKTIVLNDLHPGWINILENDIFLYQRNLNLGHDYKNGNQLTNQEIKQHQQNILELQQLVQHLKAITNNQERTK